MDLFPPDMCMAHVQEQMPLKIAGTEAVLSNLDPGICYTVRVRAESHLPDVVSAWSAPVSCRLMSAPAAPIVWTREDGSEADRVSDASACPVELLWEHGEGGAAFGERLGGIAWAEVERLEMQRLAVRSETAEMATR